MLASSRPVRRSPRHHPLDARPLRGQPSATRLPDHRPVSRGDHQQSHALIHSCVAQRPHNVAHSQPRQIESLSFV
jgi:hypothetical protein